MAESGRWLTVNMHVDERRMTGNVPSRTELKNASEKLQKISEELLALREDRFTKLSLPEELEEAIFEAKRMTKLGAKRRQTKLIGKLMRRLDPEALEAVSAALRGEHGQSAKVAGLTARSSPCCVCRSVLRPIPHFDRARARSSLYRKSWPVASIRSRLKAAIG